MPLWLGKISEQVPVLVAVAVPEIAFEITVFRCQKSGLYDLGSAIGATCIVAAQFAKPMLGKLLYVALHEADDFAAGRRAHSKQRFV